MDIGTEHVRYRNSGERAFETGWQRAMRRFVRAQGVFNELYKISCDASIYILRIALPVDPHQKTASEAATIDSIRANTTIAAPKIIAFDVSNNNSLKFEWTLMEFYA